LDAYSNFRGCTQYEQKCTLLFPFWSYHPLFQWRWWDWFHGQQRRCRWRLVARDCRLGKCTPSWSLLSCSLSAHLTQMHGRLRIVRPSYQAIISGDGHRVAVSAGLLTLMPDHDRTVNSGRFLFSSLSILFSSRTSPWAKPSSSSRLAAFDGS
jgi:hypothetical protein